MHDDLTAREQEVLHLIALGLSNNEIAQRLYLSRGTIKAHSHSIYSKLGVFNRTQALLKAQELGVLSSVSAHAPGAQPSDDKEAMTRSGFPAQLTPFIGRKAELERLTAMLDDERVRLLTILGTGGMGKTRLAIELAQQRAFGFEDGACFSSLAPISDPRDLPSTILEDLGQRIQGSEPPERQLISFLRGKNMLLVLDNFEHLLRGADLLIDLLQAAPGVKVIVTSRERLNLSAELAFVLGGLDFGAAADLVAFQQSDAARLFIDRARLIQPAFTPHAQEWPPIQEICRFAEGMPLALILAAGWLDTLTIEEIASELVCSLDILESQFRDLPVRQRSMRATLTASWKRLTEEEQRVYASLSVFRGGFTRDAAQKVAGASLRHLQTFVNRSFLTARGGRYEIHELLRQFGREQLLTTELPDAIDAAHSAYYLDFLARREVDLQGRRQQAALDEIQADFDNIQIAWDWAVAHHEYDSISAALDSLANFSVMRSFLVRAEGMLDEATQAWAPAPGEMPHPVWDQVAVRYIHARDRLSLPAEPELLQAIIDRARSRNNTYELAYGVWVMSNQALRLGDEALHRACSEEAVDLWRELGNTFYLAHALVGTGGVNMAPHRVERVLNNFRESIRLRREAGDRYELSFSLIITGIWLLFLCEFDEAERYIDESLALQDGRYRTPDFAGIASMKGSLVFWRGDFEAAEHYARLGLDFSEDMNYYGDRSACQGLLSYVMSMNGDYAEARELCELALQDELFDVSAISVLWGMALACCGLCDDATAAESLRACLHKARHSLHSPLFQILCLPLAAILAARAGEYEQAAGLLALAYAQPPDITGWMDRWSLLAEVRRDLEEHLGADRFGAAWTRGASLALDAVVAHLLDG